MRTAEPLELPMSLDRGGDLRGQVAAQLRVAVRGGVLTPGARLPSSRTLAASLGVSRATVTAALAELEGEGWLEARHGSGTYVAAGLEALHPPAPVLPPPVAVPRRPAAVVADLVPGHPDTGGLVDAGWRRAWRDAVAGPVPAHAAPPAGLPALREAVAEHVGRARGLRCAPDDVLVTAGTADALRLLADAVGVAGATAAVEDPGYPQARAVLRRAGAGLHGVPVDAHGLDPGALQQAPAGTRLLHVTPSHQYPLGGLLPVERRAAVLAWAAERGVLVVEDDYDGEFRFGTSPVPALASLDTAGCVAYVGTFSKVISPDLRLGYVVAPAAVVGQALAVRLDTGTPVAGPVQRAMASYLAGGGLRRHTARQRRLYADRRGRLVRRLDALPGVVAVRGLDAGLHAVVDLAPGASAADVVAAAARRGVLVADLDTYRMRPDPAAPGLVLGYGAASAAELDRGLDVLAAVLAG